MLINKRTKKSERIKGTASVIFVCNDGCRFLSAFGTVPLDDVFHFMCLKTFGQGDEGNRVVFETIGATATGAGKVNVVEMMAAFTAAHAVFLDA